MPHRIYTNFIRLPLPLRILIIGLTIILSFGIIIFFVEPETFKTPFDGIWWAIITASAVGYGDIVPKTLLGKLTGILLILFGAGFISAYLVTLGRITMTKQNDYLKGKVMFKGKKHTIIIGWNERAKEIIHKLMNGKMSSIVLIDQTLKENPLKEYTVHFIQGSPTLDETLKKANIEKANKVVITADQGKNEHEADMNTILSLLAIKGLNPNVTCIAEILTSEQIENAKRAGADQIIQSNLITSSMVMNCLTSEGMVESLLSLLEQLNGSKVVFRSSAPVAGKSFMEANRELLNEGCLLLGIKRGVETIVNPPLSFLIKDNDILLVIKN